VTHARILFGDLPRMTRVIVEGAIAPQADVQVVGHSADADLEAAVARCGANVVIVNDGVVAGGLHVRIVCANPDVKVVAITDAGDRASLYEFRTVLIADPSPTSLLDAIQAALGGR
jgi:hypothetical protein